MNKVNRESGSGGNSFPVLAIALSMLAALCLFVAVGSFFVFYWQEGKASISGPTVSIPDSHVADADRFVDQYEAWAVLSDFRVKPMTSVGQWEFTVNCSFETLRTRKQRTSGFTWYVEVYSQAKLLEILKFPVQKGKSWLTTASIIAGDAADAHENYQFFTYLALGGQMRTRVPVSGIIERGDPKSSPVPVVYDRHKKFQQMIEIGNSAFKLGKGDSIVDDFVGFRFEIVDQAFLRDFHPDSDRRQAYFINIEDEFGSVAKFVSGESFKEEKGVVTLMSANHSLVAAENNLLKRRPLKIYVTRDPVNSPNYQSGGMMQTLDVFSNIRVVVEMQEVEEEEEETLTDPENARRRQSNSR